MDDPLRFIGHDERAPPSGHDKHAPPNFLSEGPACRVRLPPAFRLFVQGREQIFSEPGATVIMEA